MRDRLRARPRRFVRSLHRQGSVRLERSEEDVVKKLSAIPEYVEAFQQVFGHPVNWEDMGRAIAAFERTRISSEAPSDRFLRGNETALTQAQRRGWSLCNGKARCNSCHGFNPTLPLFSDNRFHNVGVAAHKADFAQLATRAGKPMEPGKD